MTAQEPNALPERDPSKPAEDQGLFRKFNVTRVDGSDAPGGKHHGCEYFVLDVTHDPHAKAALQAYAIACEETHPELSNDLRKRHGWNYVNLTIKALHTRVKQLKRMLAMQQADAPADSAFRPDILEKLTYHRFERDDMTLDDCLTYLRTNGWHEVHGRTARQMILQLTELLASAPAHHQATEPASMSCEYTGGTCKRRGCIGQCQAVMLCKKPALADHPDVRELRKWLNEGQTSEIDRKTLARVLAMFSRDPAPSTAGEVIAWADPNNLDDVVSDRKKQDMFTVNGNPGKLLAQKYTTPLTAAQPAQGELTEAASSLRYEWKYYAENEGANGGSLSRAIERAAALLQSAPARVVPDGWLIRRAGEEISVCAPDAKPGMMYVSCKETSLPKRLLYALADALLAAAPQPKEGV